MANGELRRWGEGEFAALALDGEKEQRLLREGMWQRAGRDFRERTLSSVWFWIASVVISAVTTASGDRQWLGTQTMSGVGEAISFAVIICGIAIVAFSFHAARAPVNQRDDLRDELGLYYKPLLKVLPASRDDEARLAVRNQGPSARFTARCCVRQRDTDRGGYELNLLWIETNSAEQRIIRHAQSDLLLARLIPLKYNPRYKGDAHPPWKPLETSGFRFMDVSPDGWMLSHLEPTADGPKSRGWLMWDANLSMPSTCFVDVFIASDDANATSPYQCTCKLTCYMNGKIDVDLVENSAISA